MSDWLEIHALADEQLSAEDKARVQARVAECDESSRELRAIQGVKTALKGREGAINCEATWGRCRKRLDEVDKTHRIESFVGKYAWGLCSLFLLFIVGAAFLNRTGARGELGTSDVPRMAADMAPFLSSPRSQNLSDVVRFTKEQADQAPVRIRPVVRQVAIVRSGRAVIGGRNVLRMDMFDEQGPLNLYAVQGGDVSGVEPVPGRQEYSAGVINNSKCITWLDGNYTVMLVADRSVNDLVAFADAVCQP